MGLTKADHYTKQQYDLASICKAIGHPARIAILEQLLKSKCCICKDFTAEINLSQPTVSKHLKELKAVGLISGTIEGTSVSYCINPTRWHQVKAVINSLFDTLGTEEGCC